MDKIEIYTRPLTLKDINSKYISWFQNPKVTKFLDAKNITIDESKEYLKQGINKQSYYIYAICEKNNNIHIGNIKIGPIRRLDGVSDLVTVIGNESYWGKNIASRAIGILKNQIMENSGIRKFVASIDSLNVSSICAYKNAGFKIESKISNFFIHKKNEKYIFSDKVYVSCDNAEFDLKKFYKWKPINIEDIL